MKDPNKPKKMKKVFTAIGKVGKGIIKGAFDVLLPNVSNTIKVKNSDLPDDDKKKFDIDFPRLITAITIWILLILVFFGKIKFSDIVDLLNKLLLVK